MYKFLSHIYIIFLFSFFLFLYLLVLINEKREQKACPKSCIKKVVQISLLFVIRHCICTHLTLTLDIVSLFCHIRLPFRIYDFHCILVLYLSCILAFFPFKIIKIFLVAPNSWSSHVIFSCHPSLIFQQESALLNLTTYDDCEFH